MSKKLSNYVGEKIGSLEVLAIEQNGNFTKRTYRCKCDCGKECVVSHATLSYKNRNHSCGCTWKKNLVPASVEVCKKAGKKRAEQYAKDGGCNFSLTFREGTIKNNTSGRQGISYNAKANSYHVYIGYKNKRASLAHCRNFADAVRIRERAEEAIKEGTFENFYYSLKGQKF